MPISMSIAADVVAAAADAVPLALDDMLIPSMDMVIDILGGQLNLRGISRSGLAIQVVLESERTMTSITIRTRSSRPQKDSSR